METAITRWSIEHGLLLCVATQVARSNGIVTTNSKLSRATSVQTAEADPPCCIVSCSLTIPSFIVLRQLEGP
ncbi:hypothetical protein F5Y17DRAFT_43083 [Xylariaceae sp. FL0594]|nr:hypothetical protein F5Y17DRAFT_43083 [Xylariaceae sp. FL0594]